MGEQLFRIKSLPWRHTADDYFQWQAGIAGHVYSVWQALNKHHYWTVDNEAPHSCASPEEGKQLAEQHWQEYIKQALVPVETE